MCSNGSKLPSNIDLVVSSPNMAPKIGLEHYRKNYLQIPSVEPKFSNRFKDNADLMSKKALAPQRNIKEVAHIICDEFPHYALDDTNKSSLEHIQQILCSKFQ
jgi:hypothetical protein